MKFKRTITPASGVIALILGVALFIFAIYEKGRVAHAKSEISSGTSLFSGNPVGKEIGAVLQGKASAYDTTLMLCQVGGVILIVAGATVLLYSFSRKR